MYFVNRQEMETRLVYMERMIRFLSTHIKETSLSWSDQLAVERAVHILIEAILDTGNQMIDGFIMRDPGSYDDIIEILRDEQVIQEEEAVAILQFIQMRKWLVHQYTQLDHQKIWRLYHQAEESLAHFPDRIRSYLHEQLGPVSAFTPPRDP